MTDERKHEIMPMMAEPVAQEPVAEVVPYNGPSGSRVALYAEHKNLPIGTKLYLAPPDQSAEVSMTPAASIFKDEVARLNAEVERLREILSAQVSQAESQQTVYRNRIAELERQQAAIVRALKKAHLFMVGLDYGRVETLHVIEDALASVKGNAEVTGVTTGENDAT